MSSLRRRLYRAVAMSRWDNPSRLLLDRFVQEMAQETKVGARVLDAGAGECRHAELFSHCTYVACDRAVGDASWDYGRLDVLADLEALPFRAESFDAILCSQTLEHVSEPQRALQEMSALLKPNGRLTLTVPFLGDPLHQEPYDFYRYTPYALRRLLAGAGLRPLGLSPIGGIWFLLCCYLWFFVVYELSSPRLRVPRPVQPLIRLPLLLLARFCTMAVTRLGLTGAASSKFTYGYVAIAGKEPA